MREHRLSVVSLALSVLGTAGFAACSSSSGGTSGTSDSGSSGGSDDARGSSSGGDATGSDDANDTGSSGSSEGSSSSDAGDASSDSSGGSSGSDASVGSCHPRAGTYTTTVTANPSNASGCPSGAALGSGTTFAYPFDAAGLTPGCTCSLSLENCTNSGVACGAGCTFTETQLFNWTSNGYSGTVTVMLADGGTCDYILSAR